MRKRHRLHYGCVNSHCPFTEESSKGDLETLACPSYSYSRTPAPHGVLVILEVARITVDMGYFKTSGVEKLRLPPYRREIPVVT